MTIYATFDRPVVQTVALRVRGFSRQDVVCNPGQIDFGAVHGGSTAHQSATIEYAGSLDWKITRVLPSKHFTASIEEIYRRPGKVGYRVDVELRPDAPAGLITEGLRLSTNDPESPEVVIAATANVAGVLTASPSSLDFGAVQAGRTAARRVLLHGEEPFTIKEVHGMSDTLRVFTTPGKRSVHILKIEWQAPEPVGEEKANDFSGEIAVRSDLKDEAPLKIFMVGTIRP
jgi:hypothetical protein